MAFKRVGVTYWKVPSPPPPPPGGRVEKISANVIWGKNMKSGREKGQIFKRKRKKVERKGRKGKEKEEEEKGRKGKDEEKRGIKRGK